MEVKHIKPEIVLSEKELEALKEFSNILIRTLDFTDNEIVNAIYQLNVSELDGDGSSDSVAFKVITGDKVRGEE